MSRIGRYDNPYLSIELTGDAPAGSTVEALGLVSDDRANSHGFLWLPPGRRPTTVLTLMHPRADFTRHYAVPHLLAAGYAVLTQNSRTVGNDSMLVHEQILLDVAAGIRRLRDLDVPLDNVVMVGDRIHDIEGATAAGIPTIYVTWGYGSPAESAGAVDIVDHPAQLFPLLGLSAPTAG